MTTGIIGVLSGAANLTYTPKCDSKVLISASTWGNGGQVQINGVNMIYMSPTGNEALTLYVGVNQTITVTTSNYMTAIVSCLEDLQ